MHLLKHHATGRYLVEIQSGRYFDTDDTAKAAQFTDAQVADFQRAHGRQYEPVKMPAKAPSAPAKAAPKKVKAVKPAKPADAPKPAAGP